MIPTLQDAFNKGMEYFAKHCLRYGTIIADKSGEKAGKLWRRYEIEIQGKLAWIYKENGRVLQTTVFD